MYFTGPDFEAYNENILSAYNNNLGATPLSQRQNSLIFYFSNIDFAETLQGGSLDKKYLPIWGREPLFRNHVIKSFISVH